MPFRDITAELKAAAASLKPGDSIFEEGHFALADSMNAIELMEPKLDPGCRPKPMPVEQRIKDKSLPLHSLTGEQVVAIMDHLLALETSFMSGNSYPQTIAGCLYTHPVAIQTLRHLLGLSAYKHTTEVSISNIKKVAYINAAGQTAVIEPAAALASGAPLALPEPAVISPVVDEEALPKLAKGSPQHTLLLALLAFVTATLKSTELNHRAVLRGDLWEEDDYYWMLHLADFCWTISEEEVCALVDSADAALFASSTATTTSSGDGGGVGRVKSSPLPLSSRFPIASTVASESDAVFPSGPLPSFLSAAGGHELTVAPADDDGGGAGNSSYVSAHAFPGGGSARLLSALRARLRFRRSYLCGQALLSEAQDSRSNPSFPAAKAGADAVLPPWARRYRLAHAREAFAGATTALLEAISTAAATKQEGEAAVVVPGYRPEYLRLHLPTSVPRMTPIPAISDAFDRFKLHLAHLQIAVQFPALCSHNPATGTVTVVAPAAAAAPASSALSVPDIKGAIPKSPVEDRADLPFELNPCLAARVMKKDAGLDSSLVPETLADLLVVAADCGVASANPIPASTVEEVKTAAAALKWPSAAKRDLTAAAATVTGPQPVIPFSGAKDSPLWWPSSETAAVSNPSVSPSADAAFRPHGLHGGKREHVSFQALLSLMEDFTRLNADVVVRSILASIVVQMPPQAVMDAPNSYAPSSSNPPGLPAWRSIQARCATVFGTHTILELLQRVFVEIGVSLEQLAMEEARRVLEMLATLPMHQVLRFLCGSRLYIRRKMDAQFRDWQVIVGELDVIDAISCHVQEEKMRDGLASLFTSLGVASALDKSWWGNHSGAKSVVAASGEKGGKSGAAFAPLDTLIAADAIPSLSDLTHLHGLIDLTSTNPAIFHAAPWGQSVLLCLMMMQMEIGFEDQLYHSDEMNALFWYYDHLQTHFLRHSKLLQQSRFAASVMPEAAALTVRSALSFIEMAEKEQTQRREGAKKREEEGEKKGEGCCPFCSYSRNPASRLYCEVCFAPLPLCKKAVDAVPKNQRARWGLDSSSDATDESAAKEEPTASKEKTAKKGGGGGDAKKKAGKKKAGGGGGGGKKKGAGASGGDADDDDDEDALLELAAAAALPSTLDPAMEAARESAVSDVIAANATRSRALAEYLRLAGIAHWYHPSLDIVAGQVELCRANTRVLTALNMAGHYKSLQHNQPEPSTGKTAPAFFREPALVYAARFKEFKLLTSPRPLTYQEFRTAFDIQLYDADTAASVLGEGLYRYELGMEMLKRARTRALQSMAEPAKAALVSEAARREDLLTLVLVDSSARVDAAAASKAAGGADGGDKKGGKKGKGGASSVPSAPTPAPAPTPAKGAFGMNHDEVRPFIPVVVDYIQQREQWIARARQFSAATPVPQSTLRAAPLTSFAVLQAARLSQHAQRLFKVALANKLFATSLQASKAKDSGFQKVFGGLAASSANGARKEPLPLLPSRNRIKLSFETDTSFPVISLPTAAADGNAGSGGASAAAAAK